MSEHLQPFEPDAANPWDADAAAHLWRRAGFGAPPSRIDATLRTTPAEASRAAVEGPARDGAAEGLESIFGAVVGSNNDDKARAWLVSRMVRCEHQLREKVALFWHGHFATSIAKVRDLGWMMRQYRIFLEDGLGKFPVMLARVVRDPAMLRWLDNETNAKGHPNENFARELFELFTLGEGHYSEQDIQEAARAFTGWHILHDKFRFSKALHDDGEKTIFGRTGPFGGDDVLGLALEQPACSRFLARKLIDFFVMPASSPEAPVDATARLLRESGYDIGHTLRTLLSSRSFYGSAARRSLVKSPLDYLVGAARAFEMAADATAAVPLLREMGQDLLSPPNVKGWPGHGAWINTATWITRVNAAERLAANLEIRHDGEQALDHYGRALLGRNPPAAERQALLSAGTGKRDLVHGLLALPEAHLL